MFHLKHLPMLHITYDFTIATKFSDHGCILLNKQTCPWARCKKKKEHALERATFIIAWFVELLPAAVGSALGSPGKVHPSFGLVRCEEFLPRKSASASRIGFGLGKSNSTSLQFKLQNLIVLQFHLQAQEVPIQLPLRTNHSLGPQHL